MLGKLAGYGVLLDAGKIVLEHFSRETDIQRAIPEASSRIESSKFRWKNFNCISLVDKDCMYGTYNATEVAEHRSCFSREIPNAETFLGFINDTIGSLRGRRVALFSGGGFWTQRSSAARQNNGWLRLVIRPRSFLPVDGKANNRKKKMGMKTRGKGSRVIGFRSNE